jgi:uncharacterized protein (DUF2147 family)
MTIDDEDGKPKSHIAITQVGSQLTGTVVKLLEGASLTKCDKCSGAKKDEPILNMTILWDLNVKSKAEATGGTILDPAKGKEYSCKIKLKDPNTLEVRGYIGTPLLGRSQTWYRVTD